MDAFFEVSDAMVGVQDQLVIDATTVKRLPTMFNNQKSVIKVASRATAQAGEVRRVSAKYVQRILHGTKPQDLPVEAVRKMDLVINLKAAKQIGLTIPPNVLVRADKVIKESAGINRHGVADERAAQERSSAPFWPRVMRLGS